MTVALRPWDDPELVGYRREPVSTLRRAERLADGTALDLDGTWRFQLLPAPDADPADRWATATVPGCWTTEPGEACAGPAAPDLPWYTNDRMPWPDLPPLPPAANPTGVYEREVEVPAGWAGQRVLLHVGAAESMLVAHVDGVCVGVGTDSHLAAEFDVTHAVRPGGRHTVRLTVPKWSASTYAEDQDQWWHGGITRSVRLFTRPALHLADVRVVAGLVPADPADPRSVVAADGTARGRLDVDVRVGADDPDGVRPGRLPAGWRVAVRLLRPDDEGGPLDVPFDAAAHAHDVAEERVSVFRGRARFGADAGPVRPWSAEEPHVYDLVVELRDGAGAVVDAERQRIGFRTVAVVGPDLLLSGRRVLLRGVNRHDRHPLTGRVVTREEMRADLVMLKRFGFNAVRTSHYPNDPVFLDLTDALGLWVVDEADAETHAYAVELCDDPAYLPQLTQRVARMVRRDRNHASVVVWSLGNESDYGANHDAVAAWVRHDDPTRPVQYEVATRDGWAGAGRAATDLVAPMYASVEEIVAHATARPPDRPLVLCEYSHAMGNSNGSLADYAHAFRTFPGLQGGFVWELADHGILRRPDGLPAGRAGAGSVADGVPAPGFSWAHGGDFGDMPNDGAFCLDGLLLPDGTPKPAVYEHRELWAPVALTGVASAEVVPSGEGPSVVSVTLENRQDVRDLTWLAATWRCAGADGTVLEAPAVLPALRPGESVVVEVPAAVLAGPSDVERGLVLDVVTAQDEPWAPAGTTVCLPYVVLPAVPPAHPAQPAPAPHAPARPAATAPGPARSGWPDVDDAGRVLLPGLVTGAALALWREPLDNDRVAGHDRRWRDLGLADAVEVLRDVRRGPDALEVVTAVTTAAGEVVRTQRVTPAGDGWSCDETVVLPDGLVDLPRVGVVVRVPGDLRHATWFGPGWWETYPDRCTAPLGLWRLPVDALGTPYVTPQENGGRQGVRWLELAPDAAGPDGAGPDGAGPDGAGPHDTGAGGVRFDLGRPLQVAVRRDGDALAVHLDGAHRGVGTASCGPDALPRYRTTSGPLHWRWSVRTGRRGPDRQDVR